MQILNSIITMIMCVSFECAECSSVFFSDLTKGVNTKISWWLVNTIFRMDSNVVSTKSSSVVVSFLEELDEIWVFSLTFIASIAWATSLTFDEASAYDNSVSVYFSDVEDLSAVDSAENASSIKYFTPTASIDSTVVNSSKLSNTLPFLISFLGNGRLYE